MVVLMGSWGLNMVMRGCFDHRRGLTALFFPSGNYIGAKGGKAIGEALKVNGALTQLNLEGKWCCRWGLGVWTWVCEVALIPDED